MEDLNNWYNNLQAYLTDFSEYMGYHGYACKGFVKAFTNFMLNPDIWNPLRPAMANNAGLPVYFVGHSLGGAMAELCAIWVKQYAKSID
ncbi:hypothetical protein HK100_002528 [Physocladia obscura]|uniref:Fungal lipase-type domain-containing protein n=1 Tax=Physocladia obscura TaxID=109957 RepID=A0AAD5XFD1_9FUNG|nr:hypothetical protein HK100_002528 [Physocladia obscura]